MAVLSGWSLVTSATNVLSIITWCFPILLLAVLSYFIEYYTRFKTYWKLYLLSTLMVLAYPFGTSYYYWIYGDTIPENQAVLSAILLAGVIIASYASLQLLAFQKISLGRTKVTLQSLVILSVAVPILTLLMGLITPAASLYLIEYNLSVSAMIFIFLTLGKLTQDYIPHFRLLAYNSARLGSILLIVDPLFLNYAHISGLSLAMKYGLRLTGVLTQCLAILLLMVPVVMLIMEAQIRGVHLIPLDERKGKTPMKYRLKMGYSYLIQEENPSQSTEIFTDYVTHNHHGLMFTRSQPSQVRQKFSLRTTPVLWMTNAQTDEKSVKPKDLDRMLLVIKDFIRFDTDSILLVQRLDYLITENDFNTVLKFIHNLNDVITPSKCILLVSLDASTLSREKLALLLQELEDLTNAEKISLGEPLYSVLLFVYTENARRKTPSFKSITKKFAITKTTARKRIYELENKGLLKILTQGRYKFLEITEKGRGIVSSPAVIHEGGEDGQE
ncbi:MAG: DUF835 domain-containing protein [Candidatus Altiarchaeota archaeon]